MAQPYNVSTPRKDEKTGKTYWTRIGAAFKRDDGSFSIVLDALPIGNSMMIFPPSDRKPKSDTNGDGDDFPGSY